MRNPSTAPNFFTMMRLLVIFTMFVVGQALTPSSFLSTVDRSRIKAMLDATTRGQDEASVAYAILGYKLLGETAPNSADLCKKLQSAIDKPDVSVASIFQSSMAAKALGSCSLKLNSAANQVRNASLKFPCATVKFNCLFPQALTKGASSDSSVSDLYHAIFAQNSLGQKVDSAAALKHLTTALKKDDSLASLGNAFHIASILSGDVGAIFDRIEDAIVQADEINGKVLQFEGGLSVSAQIVTGAYALGKKVGKAPPLSKMQSVKLANYFLSRKNVQQAKGVWHLLSALTTLSKNDYHVPVAITLESAPTVSEASPTVKIRVTDVMGGSLGGMSVIIDSAMRMSDGAVVMSKSQTKAAGSDATLYEVDMMSTKPARGFYELLVTATPSKTNPTLAGNEAASLVVKVLGSVWITNVEVGVVDADQSTAPKMSKINHPDKLAKTLEADHHQKVMIKFAVADKAGGEKVKVHQAFILLEAQSDGSEIIYVAEQDSNGAYKFDFDVNSKAKEFGRKSGKYNLWLVVGDFVISNPIKWNLAVLNLQFPSPVEGEAARAAASSSADNKPKPEIRHLFREPEKRPPAMVSNAFTILCLVPFAIMIIAWMKLGVNISAFPFSLFAVGFHVGLGAIFGLYYYFWLRLDMFTTLKYLVMVGVVTFMCGNKMLVKIAENRKSNN